MYRTILNQLENWIERADRKPLILKGARQVGKTYSLEEFGKKYVKRKGGTLHYIDLKEDKKYHRAFQDTNNPSEILRAIQFEVKKKVDPRSDLLILDEIQECPGAITSLKYFEQRMKDLPVIAAGSHLGLIQAEGSFPVGKVNFLYMFPMTFSEFLSAHDSVLYEYFVEFDWSLPTVSLPLYIHDRFLEKLRYYFFTGGLPEVVQSFVNAIGPDPEETIKTVRQIQLELIESYQADFSKYSGMVNANHIHHVFHSIPMQLAKTHDEAVKRYQFLGIIPKQKGFDRIKGPLNWLIQSRLCIKSMIASRAEQPLLGFCEENRFKVYFFDIGLLHAMLGTSPGAILNDALGSYKGFVAENFVAQELYAQLNAELFSWQEGQSEIEFIVLQDDKPVPLEVKSSNRSRRAKSLESYIQRYHPHRVFKLSAQPFECNSQHVMIKLPLYFCGKVTSACST